MHIRQLRLQNIACFDDVTLDFTDESGKPCQWVVLLGENGMGKTTALQAIPFLLPAMDLPTDEEIERKRAEANSEINRELVGMTFTAASYIPDLRGNASPQRTVPWRFWARQGAKNGTVEIIVGSDRGDTHHDKGETVILNGNIRVGGWNHSIKYTPSRYMLHRNAITGGWFIAGYRTWRGGRGFVDSNAEPISFAVPAPKTDRFASLLDDYSRTTSIREWLADLDYRRLKETGAERIRSRAIFDLAVDAIVKIFPNNTLRFVEITSTKDLIFEENGIRVSVESLSDGYRSAMNWIGDLVRRLVEAFPDMKNPLRAPGVVLVDEIDLHLHPKWQRTIVEQIRSVFPNLQFIVTTHSPFIAQEMTERDKLIVLRREGDHVTATEDSGFVQGWRVDQILTSHLFGLSSTRGVEVEEAEGRRRDLLTLQTSRLLSEVEHRQLETVTNVIARLKSSPEDQPASNGKTSDVELQRATDDLLALLADRMPKLPEAA